VGIDKLDTVRKLLAKADGAATPAEAELYTAKAVELMARHGIDEALLGAAAPHRDEVATCRIPVADPYSAGKARLLAWTASALRCRAVLHEAGGGRVAAVTVLGFASDRARVELLYTSLLVQASAAMVREGSARHDTPARTKTFRQSFMHGYALHVGDRLRAAASAEVDDDRLLPVLARRDRAVADQVERVFPRTETARGRSIRVDSEAGWRSGRDHAGRASMDG